jgi:hypothetical protein
MNFLDKEVSLLSSMLSQYPMYSIDYSEYFDKIKSGWWASDVLAYRNNACNKADLPCITPSGIFNYRNADGLYGRHTQVIVLDLDFKDNQDLDIEDAAKYIAQEASVLAIHKSVSGKGLAIYVTLDDNLSFTDYSHIRNTFEQWYDIVLDKSTSDISRLRIVSYDPDIIINEQPLPFDIPVPVVKINLPINEPYNQNGFGSDSFEATLNVVRTKMQSGVDPTNTHAKWIRIGFYIANLYGEEGRRMFHIVSANHPEYTYGASDKKYSSLLKHCTGSAVGGGAIVHMINNPY